MSLPVNHPNANQLERRQLVPKEITYKAGFSFHFEFPLGIFLGDGKHGLSLARARGIYQTLGVIVMGLKQFGCILFGVLLFRESKCLKY